MVRDGFCPRVLPNQVEAEVVAYAASYLVVSLCLSAVCFTDCSSLSFSQVICPPTDLIRDFSLFLTSITRVLE